MRRDPGLSAQAEVTDEAEEGEGDQEGRRASVAVQPEEVRRQRRWKRLQCGMRSPTNRQRISSDAERSGRAHDARARCVVAEHKKEGIQVATLCTEASCILATADVLVGVEWSTVDGLT